MSSTPADSQSHNHLPEPAPQAAHGNAGSHFGRARLWLALGGRAAGLVAFSVGELVYELIPAAKEKTRIMGQVVIAPTAVTMNVATTRNGTLAFGLLGACLGGFLGIAGGMARRSMPAMVTGGLVGSIVGLGLTAGASWLLLPRFLVLQPNHPEYELLLSVGLHAAIWGLAGATAGAAFAIGLGDWKLILGALGGGFLGAVLGAMVFDLIGAGVLPFADTGQPISTTWQTRLMARLMVTVATAAFIIWSLPRSRADQVSVQP